MMFLEASKCEQEETQESNQFQYMEFKIEADWEYNVDKKHEVKYNH